MKKYFEYKDDKSSKFWEITINDKTVTTRFGKIGTAGQTSEKVFDTVDKAEKEYQKLIKEKAGKGYIEITDDNEITANDTKKVENPNAEFVSILFDTAVEKYNLQFLYSYVIEEHQGKNILVFQNDAHFDALDIDKYVAEHNVFAVLFLKNLTATNYIIQEEMDYGPLVIVLGNVVAKNVWCSGGYIYFRGNVSVAQSFIAGVYNHGELHVAGDIQAEVVISRDHMFSFKTISKGVAVLENAPSDANFDLYEIEDAIAKQYLDQGEYLGIGKIFKGIKKGESLLKSAKPNTPFQAQMEKSEKTGFTKLDLSYLNLKEIPKAVFELENLIELKIPGNSISSLPIEIKNLKKLEKLNISGCIFEQFPETILALTQLTSLNIARNYFKIIPDAIANLQSLKELNIYDCGINEFPESIFDLQNLENLNLSYLKDLTTVVHINKPLKKLKTLDISANRGAKLDVALPELEEINLQNCSLPSIPAQLFESKKLKKLDLTLNRNLKELPEEIKTLVNITELKIPLATQNVAVIQHLPRLKKL